MGFFQRGMRATKAGAPRSVSFVSHDRRLDMEIQPASEGTVRVLLSGNCSRENAAHMRPWFVPLRRQAVRIEVDLDGVRELDTGAIGVFVGISRECATSETPLCIVGESCPWHRTIGQLVPGLIPPTRPDGPSGAPAGNPGWTLLRGTKGFHAGVPLT